MHDAVEQALGSHEMKLADRYAGTSVEGVAS